MFNTMVTIQKAAGSISLSEVTLVSMFVESVLYGLFIILFIISTAILVKRYKGRKANKILLTVSASMFIFATIHIAADVRRVLDGFMEHGGSDGELELYFSIVNSPLYLLKTVAYVLQTLLGDAFVLYRLYLVWQGDKRVVLPMIVCFVASIGVAIGAIRSFFEASPEDPAFIHQLQQWVISFISLTFSTNFISTFLISSRIWWEHSKTLGTNIQDRCASFAPAAVVIVESGAIYSACLVIMLTVYLVGHFAQYIVLDAIAQVIGIVFSLVIVRVALGISSETVHAQENLTTFTPYRMEEGNHAPPLSSTDTTVYSLNPLNEEETKVMETQSGLSKEMGF